MNPALANHLRTLGLARAPFPPTPDAAAWFQTTQLEGALFEAAHCLRTRAGFVLLTGEVGTGKSTFLRRLLHVLEGDGVATSMVFNTFLQGADLLAAVLRDFGLETGHSPAADIETLNRFLVERWQEQTTCVLVIDDAQNLTLESLELLRLLTNLESGQEKLLQIVLSGQPELRENLDQPRIRQLTSRICKHVHLEALDAHEVGRYVGFRLAAAGNPEPGIVLAPEAAAALHRASGGNARRIHLIMDRCLYGLYGREPGQRTIDAALVRTAATEAGARPLRRHPRLPLALAASLCGVLLASSFAVALALRSADSHAGGGAAALPPGAHAAATASTARAIGPAAPATPAAPGDVQWDDCLRRLQDAPARFQRVSDAWLEHVPSRDGLCLRRQDDHWLAGWRTGLVPEDFLADGGDRQRILDVQTLLAAQGLYDGALDGLYGPRMRAAIGRFQSRRGLAAGGAPDAATLYLFDTLLAAGPVAGAPEVPEPPRHVHD